VADNQVRPREACRDLAGVGKGRKHVRAEEQQHAHPSIDEGLGDPRHLVRDIRPRRAALGRRDVRQVLAVRAGAVASVTGLSAGASVLWDGDLPEASAEALWQIATGEGYKFGPDWLILPFSFPATPGGGLGMGRRV
jgi:hypothetical protein